MADDLRERIAAGDIEALLDPALPLHLLADGPTAEWWAVGSFEGTVTILNVLAALVSAADGRRVLRAWCADHNATPYELSEWGPEVAVEAAGAIGREGSPQERLVLIEACRRLRALLASAPPGVDEALAILERYAR